MSLLSLIPGMGTVETGLSLFSSLVPGLGQKKPPIKSGNKVNAQALLMAQAKRKAQMSLMAKRQALLARQKTQSNVAKQIPQKSARSAFNDTLEPWNSPPTAAQKLEKEEKKNETIIYIGAGVAVLAAVYFISQGKNRK